MEDLQVLLKSEQYPTREEWFTLLIKQLDVIVNFNLMEDCLADPDDFGITVEDYEGFPEGFVVEEENIIENLNTLYNKLDQIYEENPKFYVDCVELMGVWFSSLDELIENMEYLFNTGNDNMENVESIGDLPEHYGIYFDYKKYGDDLYVSGNYAEINGTIYEFQN